MNNSLKKTTFLICLLFCVGISQQSFAQYSPYYRSLRSGSHIQDKAFYLLTSFNQIKEVKELLKDDPQLNAIFQSKKEYIASVSKLVADAQDNGTFLELNISTEEIAKHFKFSDDQIRTVEERLLVNFRQQPSVEQLVKEHLRPSGKFQLFTEMDNATLLTKAWRQTAEGVNHAIDVYALGKEVQYAAIDSARYDVHGDYYRRLLTSLLLDVGNTIGQTDLFFGPSLQFVLKLLEANNRDEAARFEPLEALENRKAFEYIPDIAWEDHPYSVILIPGYGTLTQTEKLNPLGIVRCNLAARRYKEGKAPIIIFSGGYVHPFQTRYNEAFEMKKYLIENHGIPDRAILIEPHARHTTTNFRNAARFMFSYGIPTEKKALVTTAVHQSFYITDRGLDERCKRDLGYVPYQLLKRISANDVEFLPRIESMHADPFQPLDP